MPQRMWASSRGRVLPLLAAGAFAAVVAGCATAPVLPTAAEMPLSKDALMMLGKKGMTAEAPIYIRIFKQESELEVWKQRPDGRYYHFKTYPICNWSGELGPKIKEGDRQAPEGFYSISTEQLNPKSSYYLAFNLGFPNAFDRSLNRTGNFVMIHGQCRSAGCYAMTDALMEEIYALGRDSLRGGQKAIPVHAFPFRMTDSNMARHATSPWASFWGTLKQAYDSFETTRLPADVVVCERKYVVNVRPPQSRPDPERVCPAMERPPITPFVPKPADQQTANERFMTPGLKGRMMANSGPDGSLLGPYVSIPGNGLSGRAGLPSATMSGLGFQQK